MPTEPSSAAFPGESNPPRRRLRVLLITVRSDHGGGPRHILDLIKSFQNRPVEFYIGSPDQEPYGPQFLRFAKKFFEIPPRSFSPFAFFRLLRVIRCARIDVVHSHGRGAGIYSRLLGLFTSARVLHTFHGIHRDPSLSGRVKLLIDQVLSYLSFTPIYVSESEAREAIEFHCVQKNVVGHVVENAVDVSRFKAKTRASLSDRGEIRIGAFLRDDIVKGPDMFLNLVRDTDIANSTRGHVIRWTCAGISREELSRYGEIPSSLEIIGRIPEPADWLQSLDIFVSTSRNEGLPLGVLEAMAAGCLCFLSDIPAHRVFAKNHAAVLFRPDDIDAFSQKFSALISDSARQVEIVAHAGSLISTRYSLASFSQKLFKTYSN